MNNNRISIASSSKGEKQVIINPDLDDVKCAISEEKREKKEINLTESLCAPDPPIDPVFDLKERVGKMMLGDENNEEKIMLDEESIKKQREIKLCEKRKKNENPKILYQRR